MLQQLEENYQLETAQQQEQQFTCATNKCPDDVHWVAKGHSLLPLSQRTKVNRMILESSSTWISFSIPWPWHPVVMIRTVFCFFLFKSSDNKWNIQDKGCVQDMNLTSKPFPSSCQLVTERQYDPFCKKLTSARPSIHFYCKIFKCTFCLIITVISLVDVPMDGQFRLNDGAVN